MSKLSSTVRTAMAAVAGVMALSAVAAPQVAAAQPYGGGTYYDQCERAQGNRSIVGGLVGAALGATLGSQVAASGHRTDGSLLGGALGAVGGAMVGHKTAACQPGAYAEAPPPVEVAPPPPPPPPPPPRAYYEAPPQAPAPAYYGRDDDDDDDDAHWAYGHRGERFRIAERPVGADGCTLAESPIYLPDGRVQKRFVRVCQDRHGRYQVVE
jgi:hypothetical protein